MRDTPRRRAEQRFQQAIDLPRSRRMKFLEEQGDDPEVRREVEELLASYDEVNPLDCIEEGGVASLLGRQIGPYRIVELIGEGGFGSVYLAEQDEPIQRQVALKLIKLGMDTRQVIARFEVERQALALMDHPNIARVLDAGATEMGRPYFVMERVLGVPITDYCDEHGVSMRDRLRLFVSVCQAVQHAHHKGIIHRDLKPSNVLVTRGDDVPVPKVIDFGIAKATDRRLTSMTLATGASQIIGTPEYMSPEQAEASGLDIDTRTDVYSLGVLLYELLTGKTPLARTAFARVRPSEIQRVIREEAPTAPSRRVSRLGTELLTVARSRRVHPRLLSKLIRGDLDWIVMRALEKDRNRRYETASALAIDVLRHLNHEPVFAGPPGALYRMRKFVRRNRVSVVATALIAAALVVGLALATLGFLDATAARRSESAQRTRAERSARLAMEQAGKAGAVKQFLQGMLESADPSRAPGQVITMQFILDEATRKIDRGVLAGRPEVEADVRVTVGKSYAAFGRYEAAETHLATASALLVRELGRDAPVTLEAECRLGIVLLDRGRLNEAETLLRGTLETARRTLGDNHALTAFIMNARAVSLRKRGRYDDAEALHRTAAAVQRRRIGEEHRDTLKSMTGRADALAKARRYTRAEALYRRILEIRRRVFGEKDVDTLVTTIRLGHVLRKQGKGGAAVEVLREAFRSLVRLLGSGHPRTLLACYHLALALRDEGAVAKAELMLRATFDLQRKALGELHPDTANTLTELLVVLRQLGQSDELRKRSLSMLAKMRNAAEQTDLDADTLNRYAWMLLTCEFEPLRDPEEALPVALKAAALTEDRNPVILDTLAVAYYQTGDLRSAIETQRKAVALAGARGRTHLTDPEARLIHWMYEAQGLYGIAKAQALIQATKPALENHP